MDKKYKKYYNKRTNAAKEGIDFNLSKEEFILLMDMAGITWKDIGVKGYHLSRYNDVGDYSIDNCRFIPYLENLAEKKVSEKARRASSCNMKVYNDSLTSKERTKRAKEAGKKSNKSGRIGEQNKLSQHVINDRLSLLKNSNIDIMVYGWVSKVASLWNVSHTQVRRFMKLYYRGTYYQRK